jgi:HYR domain
MKPSSILATALCAALAITSQLSSTSATPQKVKKNLSSPTSATAVLSSVAQDATALFGIIAVDYQEVTDSLIVSVHFDDGQPNNFARVTRAGVITPFSTASGFPGEVQIAVAPSQNCTGTGLSAGGFTVDEVFASSGNDSASGFATIARLAVDGSSVQQAFATMPGETGGVLGLYFDRSGNFGGDLMACTTTGGIYRVNSSGTATLVARHPTNKTVESIITLPNDSRFGPLSGKILVGPSTAETNILAVDPIDAMHPMGTFTTYSVPEIIEPEHFRIVPAGGDFFGTDVMTNSLVTAPAAGFASIVGDLLVAAEGEIDPNTKTAKLFDVVWDPVNNKLKTTEIPGGSVFQYEGVTFSCACLSATLSCAGGICIPAAAPAAVTYTTPVTSAGTQAVCTPASGSVFPVGTTAVNCTAPDACGGKELVCSFSVTLASQVLTVVDFGGSGSSFTIDVATGQYTFTCGDGFSVSGTGMVRIHGNIINVEDMTPDRCVLIMIDLSVGRAIASLKSPMGLLRCTVQGRNLPLILCM